MKISICAFPCHAIESTIELEMTIEKRLTKLMMQFKQALKKT
jgi:hypothetical protein